ncbi:FxsA protein [Klebsiella pneumoniae]|nr:FxsA protein [Klebsiella pneumoniae]
MRWIPFIAFFLYVYIEISIFIQVAHVLGVFMTLILVIFSSVVGMSLVRNQGFKNFLLMQQKMAAGESPAAEMIKSVSLIIAGLLLLLPGVLYRLPRPAAIAAAGAKAFDDEADAAPALQPDAGRRL